MDNRVRLCHCGLFKIDIGMDGVQWYWSRHTENICMMIEADGPCWCGNSKSMHWNGHAPRAIHPEAMGDTERCIKRTQDRMDKYFKENI